MTMKNKAIFSALLAMSTSAHLSAQDVSSIQVTANAERPAVDSKVYLSEQAYGDWKIRVTVRSAGVDPFKYTGRLLPWGIAQDSELVIEYVNVLTGEVRADGNARFLKNEYETTYKGFACDSSLDCTENLGKFKVLTCDSTEACTDMRYDLSADLPAPHIKSRNGLLVIENIAGLRLNGFIDFKTVQSLAFKISN